MRVKSTAMTLVIAALAALVAVSVSACGSGTSSNTASSPQPLATKPSTPDLRTPRSAVDSYLAWTSYAYSIGNSDVATKTMSANEEVRVNSYVELNKEKGQRLDQRLVSMKVRSVTAGSSRATLAATEDWDYRYVPFTGGAPGQTLQASYETTYTLTRSKTGVWVVESVEASATTPLQ